jgi:hypothetical protein
MEWGVIADAILSMYQAYDAMQDANGTGDYVNDIQRIDFMFEQINEKLEQISGKLGKIEDLLQALPAIIAGEINDSAARNDIGAAKASVERVRDSIRPRYIKEDYIKLQGEADIIQTSIKQVIEQKGIVGLFLCATFVNVVHDESNL